MQPSEKFISKHAPVVFLGLIVSGILLHLKSVWQQHLFGDEIHSLFFLAENSFSELLLKPVEPIHPNGSYLLLKTVYGIFPQVEALRILMFGVFLLSCYGVWKILEKFFKGTTEKLIGLSLWVSSAYIWHFSYQLRMYGFAFLIGLFSILALLNHKKTISLVLDWLLLFFVYGGALFVFIKWATYISVLIFKNAKSTNLKAEIKASIIHFIAATLPIFFVVSKFLVKETDINASYLYWIKTPVWADWGLGLGSFLTGLFLPYFEGYAQLGSLWIELGIWLSFFGVALGGILGVLAWLNWRKIWQWAEAQSTELLFIYLSFLLTLLSYSIFLVYSVWFQNHIFHIRQLFSAAVSFLIILMILAGKSWIKKPMLVFISVVVFALINQAGVIKDNFGANQAYVHHYESLPGKPIIATASDIELIYKQCHTFQRSEAKTKCPNSDIYLTSGQIPETIFQNTWWQTNNVARTRGKLNAKCEQVSIDFSLCQIPR